MRTKLLISLLLVAINIAAQTYVAPEDSVYSIAFWNAENLFYPQDSLATDSINPDTSYTAFGKQQWSLNRYFHKLSDMRRAISLIGEWQGLDLIGMCEIEQDSCLIHLTRGMRKYKYVHYDSPDRRGIDCALLYDTTRTEILNSRPIHVYLDSTRTTRDILYVSVRMIYTRDTLHLFVCHLPSQWGGAKTSEWKRIKAKQQLQTVIDSLYDSCLEPKIIVMGDMNCEPKNDLRRMSNLACKLKGQGTHFFHGQWSLLDQFYVSEHISHLCHMQIKSIDFLTEYDKRYLTEKPKRTFIGPRYNGGLSDHYPVVLRIKGLRD